MTDEDALVPPPPISVDEHRARIAATQERMAEQRLDALLITSEDNYRYLTGFNAPVWQNLTRPRYCIVPPKGDPVLIIPTGDLKRDGADDALDRGCAYLARPAAGG